MNAFLAAFRAQLRLRVRSLSTWGFLGFGFLLTAWGTLLDVLAVGVQEGRSIGIAASSGALIGVLLGAWIGSGTPARYSLAEWQEPFSATVGAPWTLPLARSVVAAVLSAAASVLCMLYTGVLTYHIAVPSLAKAAVGSAVAGFVAAAWGSCLTPRVGALAAVTVVLLLALVAHVPLPAPLRAVLPVAPSDADLAAGVVRSALAGAGLLALTPPTRRADGGGDPAT